MQETEKNHGGIMVLFAVFFGELLLVTFAAIWLVVLAFISGIGWLMQKCFWRFCATPL